MSVWTIIKSNVSNVLSTIFINETLEKFLTVQLVAEALLQCVNTDGNCQNASRAPSALHQFASQSKKSKPILCAADMIGYIC